MTHIKYRKFLVYIILLITIITSIILIITTINQEDNPIDINENIKVITNGYLVKEQGGKIAIFKNGADEAMKVLDVYVFNLPDADQLELVNGIIINNDEELNKIIEDYES